MQEYERLRIKPVTCIYVKNMTTKSLPIHLRDSCPAQLPFHNIYK